MLGHVVSLCLAISLLHSASSQFPAICNTPENLQTKCCCPNNCNGRGTCMNITEEAYKQWQGANPEVVKLIFNSPDTPEKGTVDTRYQWPSIVFERVCNCNGNFGGVDCGECEFGWTGMNCNIKKAPVIRKSFSRLTTLEQETVVNATLSLKSETGIWSVIVEEPLDYDSGTVTLQNVSTYDFFIFLHNFVARDCTCKNKVNKNVTIDFAHEGPVFPVWHRRYLLIVEREFQRYLRNESFGLPYWHWDENDLSPFQTEYYGIPSHGDVPINVTGQIINQENWHTVCDLTYQQANVSCSAGWRPCNVSNDLLARRALQRGIKDGGNISGSPNAYLPNRVEVMIAIAAPSYEAAEESGVYSINDPRTSFRNRLEGWSRICSADMCVLGQNFESHMHNIVHIWVGGQMGVVPPAINDPIFNFHHCNVDRILESWMQRFTTDANISDTQQLLPAYVPVSGGHPGHNRGDFMVPFFPLIKAGDQYRIAEDWGYTYDEIVPANILDSSIPNCGTESNICPTCDSSGECVRNCTENPTCAAPRNSMPHSEWPTQPASPTTEIPLQTCPHLVQHICRALCDLLTFPFSCPTLCAQCIRGCTYSTLLERPTTETPTPCPTCETCSTEPPFPNCPTFQTCPTQPECPTCTCPSSTPCPDCPTQPECPIQDIHFKLGAQGQVLLNNSVIKLEDVGKGEEGGLLCITSLQACCFYIGQFFYPNDQQVPSRAFGQGFWRNRGPQLIRLNRNPGTITPTGRYRCTIPDSSGVLKHIFITLE